MEEQLESWLQLIHLKNFSVNQKRALVDAMGSPQAVVGASPHYLQNLLGQMEPHLSKKFKSEDRNLSDKVDVEKSVSVLQSHNAIFLPFNDPKFPNQLKEIDSAPLGLFCHGNINLLGSHQIAIVGSRNASRVGLETARHFARELSYTGLTITSGLALGVDTSAHQGALEANGATISVVATGLDQVYPSRNRSLHRAIVEQGLVVTEYPPNTPPRRGHFPQRNRIISGLSLGTLVVEAGLKSGSLITARLAAEQGREVFAIPGSIHSTYSRGCHYLIRQGAALVETVDDISAELNFEIVTPILERSAQLPEQPVIDPELEPIYTLIEHSPSPIDKIIALSGLTADQVSSILIRLELCGLVAESAGGYQRVPFTSGLAN